MPPVVNIAAYQFAPLADLKPLREQLLARCKALQLRGTILLSTEGINLFIAGSRASIEQILQELRAIPGLQNLTPKYSESTHQPFTRMLVRIKKEIIAFGVPGIDPARSPAPKLSPRELKQWLDEGRPVTMIDTRNDYEVKLGTFRGALTLDLDHFRNFPAAVEKLSPELKQQPIVMFCTGGIRCEKAGPFMRQQGFENVVQLEGGILKYFEECGGAHYDGECFVFDQRVGVDPGLAATDNTLCFRCLSPLTVANQQDPRYVPNQSCPYCFRTEEEQRAKNIAAREQAITRVTTPLPGSQPYEQLRPVNIPVAFDRQTLIDALCGIFSHVPKEQWLARCDEGRFVNADHQRASASQIVRAGERYLHTTPAAAEPDVNAAIRILYEDEAIVVVNKPAPLPVHPCGRFNLNTLQSIMNLVYKPQKLRPAHRLDANTSGVLVLARTGPFASRLQPQFSRGEVEKLYVARIQGQPTTDQFTCDEPISRDAGELGGREIDETGLPARTEFQVIRRFHDGTTLVQARPITGRTNQIRLHLWQLGWPIVGEQAYLPEQQMGDTQTQSITDQPLCLHAQRLSFTHPLTGQRLTLECDAPAWANE